MTAATAAGQGAAAASLVRSSMHASGWRQGGQPAGFAGEAEDVVSSALEEAGWTSPAKEPTSSRQEGEDETEWRRRLAWIEHYVRALVALLFARTISSWLLTWRDRTTRRT